MWCCASGATRAGTEDAPGGAACLPLRGPAHPHIRIPVGSAPTPRPRTQPGARSARRAVGLSRLAFAPQVRRPRDWGSVVRATPRSTLALHGYDGDRLDGEPRSRRGDAGRCAPSSSTRGDVRPRRGVPGGRGRGGLSHELARAPVGRGAHADRCAGAGHGAGGDHGGGPGRGRPAAHVRAVPARDSRCAGKRPAAVRRGGVRPVGGRPAPPGPARGAEHADVDSGSRGTGREHRGLAAAARGRG